MGEWEQIQISNDIYRKLRECIAKLCETKSPFTNGEMELDESYFGARRVGGIKSASLDNCRKRILYLILLVNLRKHKLN